MHTCILHLGTGQIQDPRSIKLSVRTSRSTRLYLRLGSSFSLYSIPAHLRALDKSVKEGENAPLESAQSGQPNDNARDDAAVPWLVPIPVSEVSDSSNDSDVDCMSATPLPLRTSTGKTTRNLRSQDTLLRLEVEFGSLSLCALGFFTSLGSVEVGVGNVSVAQSRAQTSCSTVTHPSAPNKARVPATAPPTIFRSHGRSRLI